MGGDRDPRWEGGKAAGCACRAGEGTCSQQDCHLPPFLAEMEAASGITGTSRLGQCLAWLCASEGGRGK